MDSCGDVGFCCIGRPAESAATGVKVATNMLESRLMI